MPLTPWEPRCRFPLGLWVLVCHCRNLDLGLLKKYGVEAMGQTVPTGDL